MTQKSLCSKIAENKDRVRLGQAKVSQFGGVLVLLDTAGSLLASWLGRPIKIPTCAPARMEWIHPLKCKEAGVLAIAAAAASSALPFCC